MSIDYGLLAGAGDCRMLAKLGDIRHETLTVEIDVGGDGCDLIDVEVIPATKAIAYKLVVS